MSKRRVLLECSRGSWESSVTEAKWIRKTLGGDGARSLPLSELRILAFSLSDVGSICRVVAEKKHGLLYALVGSFWLLCWQKPLAEQGWEKEDQLGDYCNNAGKTWWWLGLDCSQTLHNFVYRANLSWWIWI